MTTRETELVPLTTTSAEGEDWWENDDSERHRIAMTNLRLRPPTHDSDDDDEDEEKATLCKPWWVGLTLAILVIVGQVLFLSVPEDNHNNMNNNNTNNHSMPSIPSSIPSPSPPTAVNFIRNVPLSGMYSNNTTTYYLTPQGQRQVQNFRRHNGLIVNIHITHHGGTTFCHDIGRAVGAPSFACMGLRPADNVTIGDNAYPRKHPWLYQDTDPNIHTVLQFFRMISWEYGKRPHPALQNTNWEHDQLVSVLIIRHPLSRALAGDRYFSQFYPGTRSGGDGTNHSEWWAFAHDGKTDNFALHKLTDTDDCCQGADTPVRHLRAAQALVQRFTIILDLTCLGESLAAVADLLGIRLTHPNPPTKPHAPLRDRIPFDDVYDYLQRKNRLDIELYEWAKNLSLVNCEALPGATRRL